MAIRKIFRKKLFFVGEVISSFTYRFLTHTAGNSRNRKRNLLYTLLLILNNDLFPIVKFQTQIFSPHRFLIQTFVEQMKGVGSSSINTHFPTYSSNRKRYPKQTFELSIKKVVFLPDLLGQKSSLNLLYGKIQNIRPTSHIPRP